MVLVCICVAGPHDYSANAAFSGRWDKCQFDQSQPAVVCYAGLWNKGVCHLSANHSQPQALKHWALLLGDTTKLLPRADLQWWSCNEVFAFNRKYHIVSQILVINLLCCFNWIGIMLKLTPTVFLMEFLSANNTQKGDLKLFKSHFNATHPLLSSILLSKLWIMNKKMVIDLAPFFSDYNK